MPLSPASTANPKTAQVTWSPTCPLWRRRKPVVATAIVARSLLCRTMSAPTRIAAGGLG